MKTCLNSLFHCFFFLFFLRDGRIKLYGRHNTQALLESNEAVSAKFLQVPFLISL